MQISTTIDVADTAIVDRRPKVPVGYLDNVPLPPVNFGVVVRPLPNLRKRRTIGLDRSDDLKAGWSYAAFFGLLFFRIYAFIVPSRTRGRFVTAEIAILNKSAVALASDSAVTISAGREEQKIYDTADKLFDLCSDSPIGIMIFNGMQFMQAPLPMLISDYRRYPKSFDRVPSAGADFLQFLGDWGRTSPESVALESLEAMIVPVMQLVKDRVSSKIRELMRTPTTDQAQFAQIMGAIVTETIDVVDRAFSRRPRAEFLGPEGETDPPQLNDRERTVIREIVKGHFPGEKPANIERLVGIACHAVLSDYLSGDETGVVFAGFGHNDIFPTLASYQVDGMAFGRLKFIRDAPVDIDREGPRAKVIPFAQKEMVERFLYGLDEDIERNIATFCKNTVPSISKQIVDLIDIDENDREELLARADAAQDAFVDELKNSGFAEIRSQSKSEIEDMVEFMPKPELATMAEALVNLTSLKRRVSRGMETVGGPIDVAVISRTEGFIWVKRKHYFPAELNPRYFHRVNTQQNREKSNGTKSARKAPKAKRPA